MSGNALNEFFLVILSTTSIANTKIELGKFSEIVEKITKKNSFKSFPDIDDIPN